MAFTTLGNFDQIWANYQTSEISPEGPSNKGAPGNSSNASGSPIVIDENIQHYELELADYDDKINTGKFNEGVSSVNAYLKTFATPLFIEYMRHTFQISPSASAVSQYKSILLSVAFRMMRSSEPSNAGWPNPPLEMFNHFAKLRACGASDGDVAEVYTSLTTQEPKLDPGLFINFGGTQWKQYSGWLNSGYLDWGDMHAQNLQAYYMQNVAPVRGIPASYRVYVFPDYVNAYGYYQDPPSSSCFAGNTLVLMADGLETRALFDIKVGDEVLSTDFTLGKTTKATVVFISKPLRAGRSLYQYSNKPDIMFTDTHPIVSESLRTGLPQLAFVDHITASSLNPTWQSISSYTINKSEVEEHVAAEENAHEILYDLLLEPEDDGAISDLPMTYVVCNKEGQRITAASEAPLIQWFPHAAQYLQSVLQYASLQTNGIDNLVKICQQADLDLNRLVRESRGLAWQEFEQKAAIADKVQVSATLKVQNLFVNVPESQHQSAAGLLENIICRLGRNLEDIIHTGWLAGISELPEESLSVVSVHSVQFLDLPQSTPMANTMLRFVFTNDNKTLADEQIEVRKEGWLTLCIHHVLQLDIPTTTGLIQLGVSIYNEGGDLLFHGGGPVLRDVVTFIGLGGCPQGEAVIKIQIQTACKRGMQVWNNTEALEKRWNSDSKAQYAKYLGEETAMRLLNMSKQV